MVCNVLGFIGGELLGPILAALIGGPLVAVGFRWQSISREVRDHDAGAVELTEDLRRWVRDRDRQLERELRTLWGQAGRGVVSRYPVPLGTEPAGAGSQQYSGAIGNETAAGMREALHEYRDEASGKVREYAALARSEDGWHRRYRDRHDLSPPDLVLGEDEREAIAGWRERPHPGREEEQLRVVIDDDPTAGERDIEPLESENGLSWPDAAARSTIPPT